jgi:hypothetical protein
MLFSEILSCKIVTEERFPNYNPNDWPFENVWEEIFTHLE